MHSTARYYEAKARRACSSLISQGPEKLHVLGVCKPIFCGMQVLIHAWHYTIGWSVTISEGLDVDYYLLAHFNPRFGCSRGHVR